MEYKQMCSKPFYRAFFIKKKISIIWNNALFHFCLSDNRRKLLVSGKLLSPQACTVAARLLIGENYWYAGLSVQRKVDQSSGLYCAARLLIGGNYRYVHWTLSPRRVLIKGLVTAKSPRTDSSADSTVPLSEAWYQSAGLFESSARYS